MDSTELTTPTGGEDAGSDSGEVSTPSYEDIAKEKGWRPKEDYEGDGEAWVGAEEFVKRQPLFDKIKVQSKKLKELEKTVEAISKHYQTNVAQAKERAILDLKAERREAIELGEAVRVDEIDQKIEHVRQMDDLKIAPPSAPAEIEQFLTDQKEWFNKNEDMTAFAVTYNESYLKKHPGEISVSLDETLKAVKKAYPEHFENKRRTAPSSVEGSTPVNKGEEKYSLSRLSSEQKLVYNQLVKTHKQMSHNDYFKSLDDAGYLE
jgi:hypothetical protein